MRYENSATGRRLTTLLDEFELSTDKTEHDQFLVEVPEGGADVLDCPVPVSQRLLGDIRQAIELKIGFSRSSISARSS